MDHIFNVLCYLLFSAYASSPSFAGIKQISKPIGKPLAPTGISKMIKVNGPHSVVQKLYANHESWKYINTRIALGDREWLTTAKALLEGSDAGSTEMLLSSIGEALDIHPSNVLDVFKHQRLDVICGGPDVDSPKSDTKEKALHELQKRQSAVKSINDPKLKKVKMECLKFLRNSKPNIERFFGA